MVSEQDLNVGIAARTRKIQSVDVWQNKRAPCIQDSLKSRTATNHLSTTVSMAQDNFDSLPLDDPQPTDNQPTSQACIALPAETIYHILRFLGPQDLIQLRAVRSTSYTLLSKTTTP